MRPDNQINFHNPSPSAVPTHKSRHLLSIRAADAVLEWLEYASPETVIDLCVSSFDAVHFASSEKISIEIYGVGFTTRGHDLKSLLKGWAGAALRDLEATFPLEPLEVFWSALGRVSPEKLARTVMFAAKSGAGSWIDPTTPAQRVTSNFYEIQFLGVLGRGETAATAIDSWRDAAHASLFSFKAAS